MPHFGSGNGNFRLFISEELIKEIVNYCHSARCKETGGIIVGEYSADLSSAIVSKILGPPSDSRSGFNWFVRGIKGVKQALDTLWRHHHQFYLGEWHYHPYSKPNPSPRDLQQMHEIAHHPDFACPEPIMLIIGGDPQRDMHFRVFVFPNGKMVELLPK